MNKKDSVNLDGANKTNLPSSTNGALSMSDPSEPEGWKASTNSPTDANEGQDRLETVLSAVGFGLWQLPLVLAALFVQLAGALHVLGTPLFTAPLPFYCSTSTNASTHLNASVYDNQCLEGPLEGVDSIGDGPPSCPAPHYNTSLFTSTVTSQWHLLCERKNLRPLFQAMLDLGNAVGTLIGGHLSDSLGRRSTIRLGAMLGFPACLIMAASPWYPLVIAMRGVMGVVDLLMLLPIYTLVMESCPSRSRVFVTVSTSISYGVSLIGISTLSYWVRDWRYLLYFSSIPSGILFFLVFLINESPRWLVLRRRWGKAAELLTRAARINRVPPSTTVDSYIHELKMKESSSHQRTNSGPQANSAPHVGLLDEMKQCMASKTLLRIIFAASLLSFCNRLLCLGVPLNANNIAKFDPRMYLIILGLNDIVTVFVTLGAMSYHGRRRLVLAALLLTATVVAIDMAMPQYLVWGRWGLINAANFLNAAVYSICLIYFVELVPTVVRSRGLIVLDLLGVLGELGVPFITDTLATLVWWSVDACFLVAAVGGTVGAFLLPETKNLPLPDTIEEVEEREKKLVRSRSPLAAEDIEDLFRYGNYNPTQGRSHGTAMEVGVLRSSSSTIPLLTAMEVDDPNSSRLHYATYTHNPQTDKTLDELRRAEPSTFLLDAKEVQTRSRPPPTKPPRRFKDSSSLLTTDPQQPSTTYQSINNTP